VTRQIGTMQENYADFYANSLSQPHIPHLQSSSIPEMAYTDHLYEREIPSTLLAKLS
jgi:hypothetical protein